jgi:hypothetical protein
MWRLSKLDVNGDLHEIVEYAVVLTALIQMRGVAMFEPTIGRSACIGERSLETLRLRRE